MALTPEWTKSSLSTYNGNCVEAKWTKSTYSIPNGDCVEAKWAKSTHSAYNGNCVEAQAENDATISVRNSRFPEGPELNFTPAEWEAFIAGVKDGEFDLP